MERINNLITSRRQGNGELRRPGKNARSRAYGTNKRNVPEFGIISGEGQSFTHGGINACRKDQAIQFVREVSTGFIQFMCAMFVMTGALMLFLCMATVVHAFLHGNLF